MGFFDDFFAFYNSKTTVDKVPKKQNFIGYKTEQSLRTLYTDPKLHVTECPIRKTLFINFFSGFKLLEK